MTPTIETWLPVPGWEDLYEASDMGRVRSRDRIIHTRAGWCAPRRGRVLVPYVDADGRASVTLARDGKKQTMMVSVLVLLAFVGPRPDGLVGCHNDGDPGNDQSSNLRWDTQAENIRDEVRHGTHELARRTHCPRGHALEAPNLPERYVRRGYRTCLACQRALNVKRRARLAGIPFDMQQVADEYHRAIMRAAA